MANWAQKNEFEQSYEALMPALSRAAVGDFTAELELDPNNSRRVNELLMGVSVLFEVIREQQRELEEAKAEPRTSSIPSIPLFDEVLGPAKKLRQ